EPPQALRSALGVPLRERRWEVAPPAVDAGAVPRGTVAVLAGPGSEALARRTMALLAPQTDCVLLREGEGEGQGDGEGPGTGRGEPAFHDEASARRILDGLPGLSGLLDLTDVARPDGGPGPWTARVVILQELIRRHRGELRVLQVTQGLQDLPGTRPSLAGSRVAGFVRMLGVEYPRVRATHLDTDLALPEAIAAEWRAAGPSAEVCHRDGRRLLPRWTEVAEAAATDPFLADPERAYLVTGGTRGLGSRVARHLVARGARRIALTCLRELPVRERWDAPGLSAETAEAVATVRDLEGAGVQVRVFTGALSGRARLSAFLTEVRTVLGPVGGVVHCAGLGSRGPAAFVHKRSDDIREVFEPKTAGLETLAELCGSDRPDFFVLFSSVSSALPQLAAGISDYAAANTGADFVAGHLTRLGRVRVRAVQWPVWADGSAGKAARDSSQGAGIGLLSTDDGLAVLDWAMTSDGPSVVLPAPRLV
ncbi:SDR family NAD(P)-dependent oxidoreductase, partial [Streptomyces sp. SID3212]|uniref:SDR family NAD(P)-dependent oxidoreductase n=1 Tax=Streptomyces sp. SID3212 TaxID=2690259 RepID=UPI00136AB92C